MWFWQKAKWRRAVREQDETSHQKSSLIEDIVTTVDAAVENAVENGDTGDAGKLEELLGSLQTGFKNTSVAPMLLLRDPKSAIVLFEVFLRTPAKHAAGLAAIITTLLEHGHQQAAAVCATVAERCAAQPSLVQDVAFYASIWLLRQRRSRDAQEIAETYLMGEGVVGRALIETLAEDNAEGDAERRAARLEEARTDFAREGCKHTVLLLAAEAYCAPNEERRNKLLRHLVMEHRATPYEVPALLNVPREGDGPFRLFLVLARGGANPPATSMSVVAETEEDAARWARVFVDAQEVEAIELMKVDAPRSGLCMPWPTKSSYYDIRAPFDDWTGLGEMRRLAETPNLFADLSRAVEGSDPERYPKPAPVAYMPPLFEAMLRTGHFD